MHRMHIAWAGLQRRRCMGAGGVAAHHASEAAVAAFDRHPGSYRIHAGRVLHQGRFPVASLADILPSGGLHVAGRFSHGLL